MDINETNMVSSGYELFKSKSLQAIIVGDVKGRVQSQGGSK